MMFIQTDAAINRGNSGRPLRDWDFLPRHLALRAAAGDVIAPSVLREGRPLPVDLTVPPQPRSQAAGMRKAAGMAGSLPP